MSKKEKDNLPEEEIAEETKTEETEMEESEEKDEKDETIEALQATVLELKDYLARNVAEYENYRKRTAKEKEQLYGSITADVITEFLPVLDSLDRAISLTEKDSKAHEGLMMMYDQFMKAFEKLNVEPIEAVGEEFDPNMHNAVMHVEDDSVASNTIVEEFAKGYKVGDRVIRYSMVKVAN